MLGLSGKVLASKSVLVSLHVSRLCSRVVVPVFRCLQDEVFQDFSPNYDWARLESILRYVTMAGSGRRIKTLPTELNKVCLDEGDGSPVHPRSYYDLDMVPSIRQNNSKNKRRTHISSSSKEKARAKKNQYARYWFFVVGGTYVVRWKWWMQLWIVQLQSMSELYCVQP